MGYQYVTEGGATPMIVGSDSGNHENFSGGGGIFVILLFIIVIAVVAIPFFTRREPVVNQDSGLAAILPAMMVMQSQSARQTTTVDSYNNGGYGCNPGPTNFQLYENDVRTNQNVTEQGCLTRSEIAATERRGLERQLDEAQRLLIQKDNQLVTTAQFATLSAQNIGAFNGLQSDIAALRSVVCKEPVDARVVGSCYTTAQPAPNCNNGGYQW